MLNFEYHSPTKVIFGKDTESQAGPEIARLGHTRILVHYGSASAQRSGLLGRVHDSLRAAGLTWIDLGGVKPNPRLLLVREGIELGREKKVDFIIAVGGGSVIDSAKGIAYGLANPFDVWELFEGTRQAASCLPVGSVVTIAAAGSELSYSTVLTDDANNDKRAYNNDICRPRFAIMNPELTYTLPEYQTMSGVVDILMHTLERYFTNDSGELVDRMGESLLITVLNAARTLQRNPHDYAARAELMWAGSLSHNGITGVGRVGDWACHQLEHELSGMFDVAHGAGLAAVWPAWARYVYRHDIARFAQFAIRVMGCEMNCFEPEATARQGIDALECFFTSIGMPTSISGLGVGAMDDRRIATMVDKCTRHGKRSIGGFVPLSADDIAAIYRAAW